MPKTTPSRHIPCAFSGKRRCTGFALVATLALMVLLAILAVGLLSLSAVSLRASGGRQAESEARANARMAMMLAIGELQKNIGPDQRITAPSALLDSDPESTAVDGVAHNRLTGVWNARDAANESLDSYNTNPPDYSRDKPNFRRWLVSNAKPEDVEQLSFAQSGALVNPTDLHGSKNPGQQVRAGKVPVKGGSYAWWVGDENTKALINRRDLLAREANPATAELLAGFGTPGAHGIKALAGFEAFESNSAATDKSFTRETVSLTAPAGADTETLYDDVTPYSQSVLASVTAGSLRKDLSLYLERTDIDWLRDWKNPNWQQGPLGPNGKIALSPLADYDVLAWKTLHHHYHMHRQVSYVGNRPRVSAIDSNAPVPIDPVSNPEWNNGVTSINPVILRMQYLLSYGFRKVGEKDYELFVYSYPVVTLWNPYNVDIRVNGYNIWLHNLPLVHKIYRNNAPSSIPDFNWRFSAALNGGTLVMRFGQPDGSPNEPIILKAGETKIFNHKSGGFSRHDGYPAANMAANTDPSTFYSMANTGHPRSVGRIYGAEETDIISLETKIGNARTVEEWWSGWQSTFEVRSEPRGDHMGHDGRMNKQLFNSTYAWRFESGSPTSNQLSKDNFPAKSLRDLVDAPTPFCLVEVRLKPLDELQLPNKTWLHNIPSLPYAGCHSAAQGADPKTPFFSHPYTVTFDQRTTVQGLFPTIAHMGPSYTPAGQRFIADREIPQVPLTSLAQLQNLPQYSMDSLNWSGHFQQNHAIGNSYASPGVPSNKVEDYGWPFYVNPYLNAGGNLSGQPIDGSAWISGVPNIDRSYAANHLLWDDYFFSSMAAQTGTFYQRFGTTRPLKTVVDDFYSDTKPLPNAAYVPHLAGMNAKAVSDALVNAGGSPLTDAHLKSAAHLMVDGGFNINSTSVPAWTILLASSHLKRPVIMDSAGTGIPAAQTNGNFVVSRFAMPIGGSAGQTTSEEARWRGYRELTAAEIRQLAEAIVRQVKRRGPFRSLGEFVNRRLAADTDETALYGALQAALEDPKVDINKDYRDKTITAADIKDTNYVFRQAALGPRYQGTPAYISQADILQPIAPLINARSDTFVIRTYGEALAPDGKTVLAKAWCEAVVQRYPEYLNPQDKPETPVTTPGLQAENKAFGRRILIKNFRWLTDEEI
jgi:type II secretory pathway pseudopilin PulG